MKSDVRTTFCPNFDLTVKALMISNSLYHRNFQTKTDMKVKICFHAKICTQNKILASKMRNLKQQKTSVFAPLILKRWIGLALHCKTEPLALKKRTFYPGCLGTVPIWNLGCRRV